ncbi:MAG TPA: CDP-diacylglycerol--glycerol-3-phosphate 3-phosphatidyltransferase [Ktedonobacterales bacterium]|nr:CDP-diacylglycerol--glycerol-3-phosphate 3-phosphatidyltransferase [Ktedonobacterales bacterium]
MQNVPNLLSASRAIAALFVFILVLTNQPWSFLAATVVFLLASMTDYFDGYLARRFQVVSPLGIFLDLTADKIFVSIILIALEQINLIPAWVVAVIITREFLVTGLRSVAAAKGTVIPAGQWGKQKTFITLIALNVLLLAKGLGAHLLSLFPPALVFSSQTVHANELLLLLADVLLLVAVLWTIISGVEYTIGALPLLRARTEPPAVKA